MMFNSDNSMKDDAKRDGMVSQIIKRLGAVELFARTHLAVQHYGAPALLPKSAVMWHDQVLITSGSAITIAHDTNQNYALYIWQNPSANGNTWKHGFFCRADTYTLKILCITTASSAKLDIYFDDVLVKSGLDFYSSPGVYNVILSAASLVVTGDGYHVLKGVANGKNAASVGYDLNITKLWLSPSAF